MAKRIENTGEPVQFTFDEFDITSVAQASMDSDSSLSAQAGSDADWISTASQTSRCCPA